ncbi:hypothetical protein AX15_003524 [Amanita polypyramis BW_CC]|nr:hypothetical protein AX15_003524 [Amanita polypyramis BW_CC]
MPPFRPSLATFSKQKSSWIARQHRDPYVKKRSSDPVHYRSRSAFKLLEIDQYYDHFLTKPDVNAVVDLGAAPGGWSQVVAAKFGYTLEKTSKVTQKPLVFAYGDKLDGLQEKWGTWSSARRPAVAEEAKDTFDPLNIDDVPLDSRPSGKGKGTIIAVDLLRIQPVPGVEFMQADFLAPQTTETIQVLLKLNGNSDGLVDIVLSDMATNASGNDTRDIESSLEICDAVFEFAKKNLRSAESIGRRKGGVLLMKHFMHPLLQQFRKEKLAPNFHEVRFVKPPSSRTESREGFFLCRGWKGNNQ